MNTLPSKIVEFLSKIGLDKIDVQMKELLKMDFSKESLSRLFEKKPSGAAQPVKGGTKPKIAMPKAFAIDVRLNEASRYFSGAIFEKALLTIDKSTLLIIGGAWFVAIIATSLAYINVKEAGQLKVKTETARALDPVLPKIVRLPLSKDQYEPLMQRLKKQFPSLMLEITGKPALKLQNNNPEEFINWLNAISYTDSMVSTIRWTMSFFCVGLECSGDAVMQAELTAEAINITQPEVVAP